MAATKKDLIDTKTKLEDINAELSNTNVKFDRVRSETANSLVDLTVKLDGKSNTSYNTPNGEANEIFLYSHQERFHRHQNQDLDVT